MLAIGNQSLVANRVFGRPFLGQLPLGQLPLGQLSLGQRLLGRLMVVGLLTAAMLAGTVATATAQAPAAVQQYKSVKPTMTGSDAKKLLRTDVAKALNNAAAFDAEAKKKINAYFQGFYFRQLTQNTPNSLANLSKGRETLFKKYLRGAKSPAAQQHMTSIALGFFRVVARDNFHPSVRYNATLILGNLCKKYAASGAGATPPQPLAEGTKELLELLEQDEFRGVKVHPSVKVAALEGLKRHIRFGYESKYADRITQAAMALLAKEADQLGVNKEVNHWIRCQAAQVLVAQSKGTPTAPLYAALMKLIADEKMSIDDRCSVVAMLKSLKLAAGANLDLTSTVLPIGLLTQATVDEGAEIAEEFKEKVIGKTPSGGGGFRGGGRFGGGGGGGFRGSQGEQGPQLERRLLLARLTSITAGIGALNTALPAKEKQKLVELANLLSPVMQTLGAKDPLDLEIMTQILQLQKSVNTLVNHWKPTPPADTEEDDDDELGE